MSYESSPSNCEPKFAQNSNLNGDPHKYMIQKSLPKLIQKIAQEASTNNNWAPALRAAPAAISVMATCLVASTSKLAGAIEVNPTGVIPGGEEIKLPHKYLSTNLQYCSDLGRIAFSEAQNSMHRLRGLFGKSASRKADEERARKEAKEDHEKRQQNERARYDEKLEKLLQKRQHELNVAKEEAQERLKTAQTTFEMVQTKLEHAKTELSVTKEQHLQAKLDLDASQADLEALANEKIELKDILAIIESSIKSLKQMKQYVDDMCEFFKEVSTEVQNTMDGPMHKFLTKIDNAAIASGNRKDSRKIENLNVDQVNKGQLAQAALRLQGKLSIIGDVAGVYVSISKLYIKPGINKMEGLTYLSHSEYTLQLAEFKEWCSNSVEEIEGFSRKQTRIMIDRMAIGVRAVARETLAIESST
ncbi:hypothetical protein TWF106_010427 [Orbilia oligospora]|uniref:Uncharacterized protein n=1 Tax=Orbilia oligospora TaxID=2813651 RepID=A0A7C8QGG9_ORBOL|nr:hypothetical protein TWF788_011044 [Orbilia oligospora]KAF3210766.1 hypothetical protein TWF106_010427 [Orbilia oligospora]